MAGDLGGDWLAITLGLAKAGELIRSPLAGVPVQSRVLLNLAQRPRHVPYPRHHQVLTLRPDLRRLPAGARDENANLQRRLCRTPRRFAEMRSKANRRRVISLL